jgi:hypothetical protein
VKERKKVVSFYFEEKTIDRLKKAHEKTRIPKSIIVEQGAKIRIGEIERKTAN